MTPLAPLVAGAALLVAAVLTLRTYGGRFRVARLLATTPPVSIAEAVALAAGSSPAYIRVDGRIDSEDAFEDVFRRPLVFRRTRLQARSTTGWRTFEDGREQVPFEVGDGLQALQIDADSLHDGLVVIPRESRGTVADVADRAPAGMAPTTAARVVIEQISAVEQAIVLGVPVAGRDGRPRVTSGLGRPLVLTTLDVPEAMRVIAGERLRPRLVVACAVGGIALVAVAGAWAIVGA